MLLYFQKGATTDNKEVDARNCKNYWGTGAVQPWLPVLALAVVIRDISPCMGTASFAPQVLNAEQTVFYASSDFCA